MFILLFSILYLLIEVSILLNSCLHFNCYFKFENCYVEDFSFFLEQYIIEKPFPVLCGPCVFVGTLYPVTSEESVVIRMEYAISGPEENRVSLCFYLTVTCKSTKPIQDKVFVWYPKTLKGSLARNEDLLVSYILVKVPLHVHV